MGTLLNRRRYMGGVSGPPLPETRIVAVFNVVSTSSNTELLYSATVAQQFSAMEIDGVAQQSVVYSYRFSTTGDHTVKYTLADDTTITESTFRSCARLKSITIPDSVISIGSNVFRLCSLLESVALSSNIETIGSECFYNCSKLPTITLPDSITSFGNSTFNGCSLLNNVVLPSVTTIPQMMFQSCAALTAIVIPETVVSIVGYAFRYCSSLASVTVLPTTPPSLGASVFDGNADGRKIYVPSDSVNSYKSANRWSGYASDIEAIPT